MTSLKQRADERTEKGRAIVPARQADGITVQEPGNAVGRDGSCDADFHGAPDPIKPGELTLPIERGKRQLLRRNRFVMKTVWQLWGKPTPLLPVLPQSISDFQHVFASMILSVARENRLSAYLGVLVERYMIRFKQTINEINQAVYVVIRIPVLSRHKQTIYSRHPEV